MTNTLLHYPLSNGFVNNWLVAGPLLARVPEAEFPRPAAAQHLLQSQYDPQSGVDGAPVDLDPLGPLTKDNPRLVWHYHACRDDHYVDFTTAYPAWGYVRGWAYAQLNVATAQEAQLVLTTSGPADLWLNGKHLYRREPPEQAHLASHTVTGSLTAGANEILVRFEGLDVQSIDCVMALRVAGLAGEAEITLPTHIEPVFLPKRAALEKLAGQATLDRYINGYLDGDRLGVNEPFVVSFPAEVEGGGGTLILRAQSLQGDIFQERTTPIKPGLAVELIKKWPLRNGAHHLAVWPPLDDYYERQLRFERKELFYVVRTPYSLKAGADLEARAREALEDAAERRGNSLYSELAKMALGQWEGVDRKVVERSVLGIQAGLAGSLVDMLGLLGVLLRFRKKNNHLQSLGLGGGAFITDFPHWRNERGEGGLWSGGDTGAESGDLLYLTCEALAGQLYPDRQFAASGKKGRWHRDGAVELLLADMRQHGRYGFQDWHSPAALELTLAALSHLADLANADAVRDLASVLMDKLFFDLAVNSFQGAYGATKGRVDIASVLSARLEPTSGVARLMWGQGNWNESLVGTVSLACCRKYELPEVIRKIATSPVDAFWSRERQALPAEPAAAAAGARGWEVETVTYKTQDFMLSSAQTYRAGQPGASEHIWQATLGPDAIVYVNHPANLSEDDGRRPNLWAGNGVLPRVAQWGDVLIGLYQLPEDDWLGYTHAYFPAAAFDETALRDGWAFARRGNGYVALRAAQGQEFITTGPTAFRELRSPGRENVWLCHLGQALLDGTFAEFQEKIVAMPVSLAGLTASLTSLRGDKLSFSWEAPLLINGETQPLDSARHIENPYCTVDLPALQMDIVFQEQGVRLRFE